MQCRYSLRHHYMGLQLWATHTERCFELHGPHGWIGPKDNFDIMVKINSEIDLTGVAMRLTMHLTKVGMPLCCAAARWTKQIPRHVKDACTRRPQEHFKNSTAIYFPMICERVRSNALQG